MKLSSLSTRVITSLTLVSEVFATAPSLLSEDVINLQPRADRPSTSDPSKLPARLRTQQAELLSRGNTSENPSRSPSRSPTGSSLGNSLRGPQTDAAKADEAEARASRARTHFKQTGAFYQQRMKEMVSLPQNPDPGVAHRDRLRASAQYRAVPVAKEVQADAYKHAAKAAEKAGRPDRQDRNLRKAAAAEVTSKAHFAHLDRMDHESNLVMLAEKHASSQWWLPDGHPRMQPLRAAMKQAGKDATEAMEKQKGLFRQAKNLRENEGGRDTDSDTST